MNINDDWQRKIEESTYPKVILASYKQVSGSSCANKMNSDEEDNLLNSDEDEAGKAITSNQQLFKMLKEEFHKSNDSLKQALVGKIDDSNKRITTTEDTIKRHNTRIDKIEHKLDDFLYSAAKQEHTSELNKQNALKNNLCLVGIPRTDGENLRGYVNKICTKIGVLCGDDILDVYRVKNVNSNIIIVKIATHATKMKIVTGKKDKKIVLADIVQNGSKTVQIFINNQFTPFFSNFNKIGRDAIKQKKINSCWLTKLGFVVKKTETAKQTMIYSEADLIDIINADDDVAVAETALKRSLDISDSSPLAGQSIHQPSSKKSNSNRQKPIKKQPKKK